MKIFHVDTFVVPLPSYTGRRQHVGSECMCVVLSVGATRTSRVGVSTATLSPFILIRVWAGVRQVKSGRQHPRQLLARNIHKISLTSHFHFAFACEFELKFGRESKFSIRRMELLFRSKCAHH